jgi:hypothetical protein
MLPAVRRLMKIVRERELRLKSHHEGTKDTKKHEENLNWTHVVRHGVLLQSLQHFSTIGNLAANTHSGL